MSSRNVSSMLISRRKPLAACMATMFALSAPGLVHAAVDWQVTSCADTTTSAVGTLRWAAANANGANGDTINLTTITDFTDCGSSIPTPTGTVAHVLPIKNSSISLTTGGVTINGPGHLNLAVTAEGYNTRVFTAPGNLTINNLQVKYGTVSKAQSGTYYGGCIYASNKVTLNNVDLTHCYVTNTGSAKGGAVASGFGDVIMSHVTITRSTVTSTSTGNAYGGAVYAFHNISMTDSDIYPGYTSSSSPGALGAYVTGGTRNAFGGALHSQEAGYTTYLSNSFISDAKASVTSSGGGSANGGAIWSYGSAVVLSSTVTGSSTSAASGLSKGGGIFSKGQTSAKYAYISRNSSGNGGGVYSSSGFLSEYSLFFDNYASGNGGAVDMPAGNSSVRGTSVVGNEAKGPFASGFDFHAHGTSTVSVTQSTFAYNFGSFALYSAAFGTTLSNNTVVFNYSPIASMAGVSINPGNANSTVTISSNLMSGNTSNGSTGTKNDFQVGSGDTVSGDHNLIRTPGTGVPTGTITGKCPLLYRGVYTRPIQYVFTFRQEVKSPGTNTGSNPQDLTADLRGGSVSATSPPRVSGEPSTTALPDIGSYEIDESDEIFDNRFETCN